MQGGRPRHEAARCLVWHRAAPLSDVAYKKEGSWYENNLYFNQRPSALCPKGCAIFDIRR